LAGLGDVRAHIERFNLRRVYDWLLLAGLVGVVGGLGALAFKWLADRCIGFFWGTIVGTIPATAGGEPTALTAAHAFVPWLLLLAPALGGLASGLLVYHFAPEAEGHGTDAAIRAYHRGRGVIRARIPAVKMLASALTLGSGGSAGREGPIAQIGAGFGSLLGTLLRRSERERSVLLAAGVSAGIGAIFRAPLAGAIFAAEVLYREPDIEAEVVVPALLSSIVSYSIYCSVHGFGHLFTGTAGFAFDQPASLACFGVLGLVTAFGGIAFVTTFDRVTRAFGRWSIPNHVKPAIGGLLVGVLGLVGYEIAADPSALAVMGSGYGTLQRAVSEVSAIGPPLAILLFVALGKIVTTSVTIGSGGSGGVFGPSMVIGGCFGAVVGTLFHTWFPEVVPNVGPFTIVGMAGFFAGVAKTPISTLLMVGDLTGNYSLLLPSMLVVCLSMIIVHRWTIYPEQVRTRAESPAHRGELLQDALGGATIAQLLDGARTPIAFDKTRTVADALAELDGRVPPLVGVLDGERVIGFVRPTRLRNIPSERALQLVAEEVPVVAPDDPVQLAVDLLAVQEMEVVPVVGEGERLVGMIDRRDVIAAYRRRLLEAAGGRPDRGGDRGIV